MMSYRMLNHDPNQAFADIKLQMLESAGLILRGPQMINVKDMKHDLPRLLETVCGG